MGSPVKYLHFKLFDKNDLLSAIKSSDFRFIIMEMFKCFHTFFFFLLVLLCMSEWRDAYVQHSKKETFRSETGKIILFYQCGPNHFCTKVIHWFQKISDYYHLGEFMDLFGVESFYFWALYIQYLTCGMANRSEKIQATPTSKCVFRRDQVWK